MDKLYIIKIGGEIINDDSKLKNFLHHFSLIAGKKILVHGGGKMATELAVKLNVPQQMVEGRRITDTETLKIITMVYAGYINKIIVAQLQSHDCNSIGLSGADGNLILAHKREAKGFDYGFAGDVVQVNTTLLDDLLRKNMIPVVCPITHDAKGQLLNTNADTIAQEVATSLTKDYTVRLVYGFGKRGVLENLQDETSVLPGINSNNYNELKTNGTIHSGMIPKIDNAFAAVTRGVEQVIIGNAEELDELIAGTAGTIISNE